MRCVNLQGTQMHLMILMKMDIAIIIHLKFATIKEISIWIRQS